MSLFFVRPNVNKMLEGCERTADRRSKREGSHLVSLINHQVMKTKGGVELQIHMFLTSTLDGTSRPRHKDKFSLDVCVVSVASIIPCKMRGSQRVCHWAIGT